MFFCASEESQKEFDCVFSQTLLDRFDYDDEPDAGEDAKKEDAQSVQPAMYTASLLLYVEVHSQLTFELVLQFGSSLSQQGFS